MPQENVGTSDEREGESSSSVRAHKRQAHSHHKNYLKKGKGECCCLSVQLLYVTISFPHFRPQP
jgi:hypothetical protein